MKALSIKNPWAFLHAFGIKDIENRNWRTSFRGKFYIHASGKPVANMSTILTLDQTADVKNKFGSFEDLIRYYYGYSDDGAIIGEATLVDCIENSSSVWAQKPEEFNPEKHKRVPKMWHWVIEDAILYDEPILNVKGELGFWDYYWNYEK